MPTPPDSTEAAAPAGNRERGVTRARHAWTRLHGLGPVVGLVALCIAGFLLNHDFATVDNAMNVLTRTAFIGIIAVGMCFVIISGGIDLSVGSMFALCDFCALFFLNVMNWPVPAVIVATLICGMALGAINGLLIGYLRLRAFITTLITLIIFRSAYDLLPGKRLPHYA